MASDLNLDAIEQRANAATKEPWDFWIRLTPDVSRVLVGTHDKPTLSGALPQVAISMEIAKLPTRINPSGNFIHNRDAEFIAHARTDIPALIARVRELEASLAKVDADCDMIIRWIDTRQLDNDALRTLCHLMKDTAKGLADAK